MPTDVVLIDIPEQKKFNIAILLKLSVLVSNKKAYFKLPIEILRTLYCLHL